MAASGNVENMLTGLTDPTMQRVFKNVFRYVLTTLAFGRATGSTSQSAVSTNVPAENLSGGYINGRTPSVANTEFAIAHNFGRSPYLCIPVLPLDQVGASIVRTTVSRAADSSNIYLKSPDVNQPVYFYVEG